MKIFAPSTPKQPVINITVTPPSAACQIELYLGPNENTKTMTSGLIDFVSLGTPQPLTIPIVMPAVAGTYHVYVDLYIGGVRLAAFLATEDIVIAQATFGGITW